jgi:hypothetical protein
MKVSYKLRKRINSTLGLGFGLAVVLCFQNCSDLDSSNVVSLSDVQKSILEDLPFAYNLKIDQLSYMSCSGQSAAQDARSFTIKAGGYFPGSGVGLRSNFTSQIQGLNADVKAKSLSVSSRNDQSGVVMAIRSRSNLQTYLDPTGESGEIPLAKMMFNENQGMLLSNERVAKQLVALGPDSYLNYVAGLPGLYNKAFDGVVRIANDLSTEDLVRNILRNSHYLSINFAEPFGSQPDDLPYAFIKSPWDTLKGDTRAKTSVFGLGYILNFQQFEPLMTTVPARAMTINSTVNLENSSIEPESWDCSLKFVVVRPEDASRLTFITDSSGGRAQVCDVGSDSISGLPEDQKNWERIRNILPVEDWYVTMPRTFPSGIQKPGCVVPKGNDFCYDMNELNPDNNVNVKIAYYRNEDLDSSSPVINYTGTCGPGTFFACPHALTICYKR